MGQLWVLPKRQPYYKIKIHTSSSGCLRSATGTFTLKHAAAISFGFLAVFSTLEARYRALATTSY